ncbi:MAG: hypothetical protein KDE27_31855, partial [Planctomycetes bacterium]|nr:hypothetical protein [Planctomycetota bacterium]
THLLAGGAPCCEALCAWSIGAPQDGKVLAALAAEVDGSVRAAGPPVLVRWRLGRGDVLALGIAPAVEHADDELRANSRRLLANLLAGSGGQSLLLRAPAGEASAASPSLAEQLADRELPCRPLLAHWGWRAPIAVAGDPDSARTAAEIAAEVIAPSWAAGADLVDLGLADTGGASPLPWADGDPLRRPDGYRGDAFGGGFSAAAFGTLADEAHGRGMLLSAFLEPPPFGNRTGERLASLRFFARELADVRRLGSRALDAFGLRRWFHDAAGYSLAMLQDFQPAAALYGAGELGPHLAGGFAALDAEDGAVHGLAAVGLSARWRDGFPADLFPGGVLDARSERPLPSEVGASRGGGSYADWLVTQCNDFVRARAGAGATLWWRSHDPATLGPHNRDYVHGLLLDPLRAAVAVQASATGRNGYRSAARALIDDAPDGFGGELPVGAAVHLLQNNWFRLLGSGGALLFDPSGQARFRPGEAVVVSPEFLHTRLFGGRPHAGAIPDGDFDFLLTGSSPEGGYGSVAVVGPEVGQARQVPAMLAFDDRPRWPQRVRIEVTLATGYYELELLPRPVRHRGILVCSLDDTVLHCEPFRSERKSEAVIVPVHVARSGLRALEFAVAEGGAVALDRLRLVRRGDVAAEGEVRIPAGHLAVVGERSASSYHEESVELAAIADFPGFVLRIDTATAARNLRVERTLNLPGYSALAAAADGAERLRRPFVVRAGHRALPDLVVVPLQLMRYEHFRFESGKLTLHGNPEAGAAARVGFWLAPHGRGDDLLAIAPTLLRAVDQPLPLDLGDRGEATLTGDLQEPWTRVVRIATRSQTPYLVRENGWWTWRGAQPLPAAGGDLLRVCQLPGDAVEIVGGPAVLARTRPGPGALRVVALRDVEPLAATVRVLQRSRLAPPSVTFASDFSEVLVDGQPWRWFDGRTVFLPDRPGDYRVTASQHAAGRGGSSQGPRIACTRAPLLRCEFDDHTHELVIVCGSEPGRPIELPFTAILRGGRPVAVDRGTLVAETELPHVDADARARAAAGGVLLRFFPGTTRVRYAN